MKIFHLGRIMRRILCFAMNHRYCKCGWCIRHPICLDCNYDKVCNEFHKDLLEGLKCQESTYDLLELRGVLEN